MLTHLNAAAATPARVVVLGSSGFIGTRLTRQLSLAGIETLPIASRDVDLARDTAPAALEPRLRPDDVIVLLACLTPERGNDEAARARNIAIAEHAGRAVGRTGAAQIIHVGSDAVYPEDGVFTEATSPAPASLYGKAHLAREGALARAAAGAGVPLTLLRVCAVYGQGDTHNAYGPNRFMQSALATGRIELFGGGEDERDHIHVDDVCAVVAACAARRSSGTVNVATGRARSFAEVARLAAGAVDAPVEIVSRPRQQPVTRRHHDIAALRRAFPELPLLPLDLGLRRMTGRAALAS